MPISSPIAVALVGNPNTGKSTLFSALAGIRQRVGNYPGVTVEKKVGSLRIDDRQFTLVDLPGTYSLAPRSPDEMVAVDVLLGREAGQTRPDVVLCIVDASNLQRNLYLVSQVLELGLPTILTLNMCDVAQRKGMQIDIARLERQLGVPVVEMQANRRLGVDPLRSLLARFESYQPVVASPFPKAFAEEVAQLEMRLRDTHVRPAPRFLVERLLLDTSGYIQHALLDGDVAVRRDVQQAIDEARARLSKINLAVPGVEAVARYEWVGRVLEGVVTESQQRPARWSDRLDHMLTHKVWGTLLLLALMVVISQSVFSWATPLMEATEGLVGRLGDVAAGALPAGALQSLMVDGVIAGVGGVLVFLPQIFILFFFIAVLEDCGYMARAAYLMDKLMSQIGLSGKSFIPLLSSFACAVPGIMAARVIENRRDRLVTILIAPLMSCSARLPVYTLLIAAFIPARSYLGGWVGLQGMTMVAMYLIGMVVAAGVALVLKKTLLPGDTPPFVMELPSYKLPSIKVVAMRVWERGWAFVRRAGTLILAVAIIVWAAAYYPRSAEVDAPYERQLATLAQARTKAPSHDTVALSRIDAKESQVQNELAGARLRNSYLGRAGQAIEPAVRPLGWDWRIGCAAIASFPAREVVVGTLGVIYNLGNEQDEKSPGLRVNLQRATWDNTNRLVFNVPVALSLMVFFALCAQCAATLVVMRRETNSWRWPLFAFAYMTSLAYVGALITYQVGMRLATF